MTFVLWAAAAAGAAYWGLRLSAPRDEVDVPVRLPAAAAPDAAALARVLGAVPQAAAPAASRYVLLGVLAGRSSGSGAALIAVDGQPARPYRVGATVAEGVVVQSLGHRQAQLGPAGGAATVQLELPPRR
nr:type II secretion system protein N [Xylophilus sp.]